MAVDRGWHGLLREVALLAKAMEKATEKIHKDTGLTGAQRRILRQLTKIGPATVSDMARENGLSRQSQQNLVNELLKKEMVRQEDNPRHGKSYLITYTETGKAAFDKARDEEDRLIEEVLGSADEDRVEKSIHLLKEVRAALEGSRI
ncbi:MarR family transcriptional regulator [Dethiosulfovibrio sp. F2B]|uniref:MarR family winged helix-turn-helix transcriptional regulator n=1 Tax=Dethiosulfovibrio faecalis TaxID=2720018 RepID=UPI001F33E429|nr:MarR family transcriptional regulator [Dethiosulfovibrio faecalis]MCF4150903.1 MarR family transcriptional regulator [Dethiosulfovibrio faecalis]